MGYTVEANEHSATLYADFFGELSFGERLAAFDSMRACLASVPVQTIVLDFSLLEPGPSDVNELYFAEVLSHYNSPFEGRTMVIIHPEVKSGTQILSAYLSRAGLTVRDFTITRGQLQPIGV